MFVTDGTQCNPVGCAAAGAEVGHGAIAGWAPPLNSRSRGHGEPCVRPGPLRLGILARSAPRRSPSSFSPAGCCRARLGCQPCADRLLVAWSTDGVLLSSSSIMKRRDGVLLLAAWNTSHSVLGAGMPVVKVRMAWLPSMVPDGLNQGWTVFELPTGWTVNEIPSTLWASRSHRILIKRSRSNCTQPGPGPLRLPLAMGHGRRRPLAGCCR